MSNKTKKELKIERAKHELNLILHQAIYNFEPEDLSCPELTKLDIIDVLASLIKTKSQ